VLQLLIHGCGGFSAVTHGEDYGSATTNDVDQTIANLGRLSKEGMLDTDIEIINIMRAKQQKQ
jgi:L-cysteine desulfidase